MEMEILASPTRLAQLLPVPRCHGHRHAATQRPSQHIGRLLQAQRLQGRRGQVRVQMRQCSICGGRAVHMLYGGSSLTWYCHQQVARLVAEQRGWCVATHLSLACLDEFKHFVRHGGHRQRLQRCQVLRHRAGQAQRQSWSRRCTQRREREVKLAAACFSTLSTRSAVMLPLQHAPASGPAPSAAAHLPPCVQGSGLQAPASGPAPAGRP